MQHQSDLAQEPTIGFFAGLYLIFTRTIRVLVKTTEVVETNVDSMQELSNLGNTHAKLLTAEATIELKDRLQSIN